MGRLDCMSTLEFSVVMEHVLLYRIIEIYSVSR